MHVRWYFPYAAAISICTAGAGWIYVALRHFQKIHGGRFYGLAGHYNFESSLFYNPGGERIYRWTILVPSIVTCIVLAASLIYFTRRELLQRSPIVRVSRIVFTHVFGGYVFLAVMA